VKRSSRETNAFYRLLKQAKRHPHEVKYIHLVFLGVALLLSYSLVLLYRVEQNRFDPELHIRAGCVAYIACLAVIGGRRQQLFAVLEKMAPLSEKSDLNVLIPFLAYYSSSQPFFLCMGDLFAQVTEEDVDLLPKSHQENLVRCFESMLKETKERKAKRLSEGTQRPRVLRLDSVEKEKYAAEVNCRLAEGILQALSQVGDKASLHAIEKLIRNCPDADPLLKQKMQAHLTIWRERLSRLESAKVLLRPSFITEKNILLRPAESEVLHVRELLRPGGNDGSSPS
jgi:hypothetical protein